MNTLMAFSNFLSIDLFFHLYGTVFEEVGFDPVDLTLVPHIAGVAIKAEDAGLSKQEKGEIEKKKESNESAERAFAAFERGRKKRRKKKKNAEEESEEASA